MTEWTLHITYKKTPFDLKAVVEYESSQLMRIRVYGTKSSILLENNYPLLYAGKSKKGITWQIKEGKLSADTTENSRLLMNIIAQLEEKIKEEFIKRDRSRLFG